LQFKRHPEADTLDIHLENLEALKDFGKKFGYDDIFADNNLKSLQVMLYAGTVPLEGRHGNDAVGYGREFEVKTFNVINKSNSENISTSCALSQATINRYRKTDFLIGRYNNADLIQIFHVNPKCFEKHFSYWEYRLINENKQFLRSPSIPFSIVRKHGKPIW
jgi:hypothetical protein